MWWSYVLTALGSSVLTTLVLLVTAYRLRKLLVSRLTAVRLLAQTQRELENRRVAYDSGRVTLARHSGGQVAREIDGMGTRPGALAKYLRNR